MSDRDHFAELSYKMLQKDDLVQQDRQFWVEYILRLLRGKDMIETYTLGDIIEWNFTGDNIVFTQEQLEIPIGSIISKYFFSEIEAPPETVDVYRLAVSGTSVYGAGAIGSYKGITCNGVFRFDALSGGYYTVGSITEKPNACVDIAVDSSENVYVVGSLSSVNGSVAYWNGSAWAEIGSFLLNSVDAVDIDSDDLVYLGGDFTNVGDANGDRIVSWNGAAFASLGSGLDNDVRDLACDDDDNVYAVGDFTGYVSKWNGSSWTVIGTGFNAAPSRVKVYNGDIYISGTFTTPYPYFVKWDGESFSGFGSGLGCSDFAVLSNGDIYGSNSRQMYFWSGSSWDAVYSELSHGSGGPISMEIDTNDNLYLGEEWVIT